MAEPDNRVTWREAYERLYAPSTRRSHLADLVLVVQGLAWADGKAELSRNEARTHASQWARDLNLWRRLNQEDFAKIGEYLCNRGYAFNTTVGVSNTVDIFARIGTETRILAGCPWAAGNPGSHILFAFIANEGQKVNPKHQRRRSNYINIEKHTADRIRKSYDLHTPISRQKALVVHLGLNVGMRVKQMVELRREDIDIEQRKIRVQSTRSNTMRIKHIPSETVLVLQRYLEHDAPSSGRILRRSRHNGELGDLISTRGVNDLVRRIGEEHEIEGLSPDDLYNYWRRNRKGGDSERP